MSVSVLTITEDISQSPGTWPSCFPNRVKGYTKRRAPLTDRSVCWKRERGFCGSCTRELQVCFTYSHPLLTVHSLFQCVFCQSRAWEQGPVIGCNWAKLPLIRWIEKRPVPQKGTSLSENSPPFLPTLGQGTLKSVPDEGFPVGIRCSCSAAYQTRDREKKSHGVFER